MAIGHQLLKIMYHLLTRKEKYQEFGEEYYEQRQLEAKKKKAIKSLQIVLYCLNFKFIFRVAFFKNFLGTFFRVSGPAPVPMPRVPEIRSSLSPSF